MGRVWRIRGLGAAAVAAAAFTVGGAPTHAQTTGASAGALLGSWELVRETPRGTMTSTFTFAQDGDSVLVSVGQGENAVAIGRVELEGETISFPFDMRAMMAGMRDRAGAPPEAGQRRAGQAGQQRAGVGRAGQGRAGVGAGAGAAEGRQRADMPEAPRFTGTLQGDEIRGAFMGRMGEQALVLRRVGAGG